MNKLHTKLFKDADFSIDKDKREIVATISTDMVDRDLEIILPKGMTKKNYAGNPIVLLNHENKKFPIGKALWVKAGPDGRTIISKYKIHDRTEEARVTYDLIVDGYLTAHSVGIIYGDVSPPTEKELRNRPDWAGAKNVVRTFELVEFSVVGVPANPGATVISKSLTPAAVELLGEEFAPIPDVKCWGWEAEPTEPEMEVEQLPMPRQSKSWHDVKRSLSKQFTTDNDLLNMLRGRV